MKLEEEFVGRRKHFAELLQNVADQLLSDQLIIRGTGIQLPDTDMEYKIRHKMEDGENKLSISIGWLDQDDLIEKPSTN